MMDYWVLAMEDGDPDHGLVTVSNGVIRFTFEEMPNRVTGRREGRLRVEVANGLVDNVCYALNMDSHRRRPVADHMVMCLGHQP